MKLYLAFFLILHLTASAAWGDDLPMHVCDRFAANASDPERKGSGVPFEQIDAIEAIRACIGAVEKHPDSLRLKYQLGRAYDAARDFSNALKYYKIAAENGYMPAQYNLGILLMEAEGGHKDYAAGFEWIRSSAEQGNPSAQAYIGYLYLNGQGVAKDADAAIEWYRKAADQGDLTAAQALKQLPEACPSQKDSHAPTIAVADLFIDLSEHVDKQVIVEEAKISAAGNDGQCCETGILHL